jgi:RecB family exonuclease
VAAVEKPEEITRLSPRDRGSLVHLILERYVLSLLGGQARSLDRLLAIADEAEGEWEAKGLTGKRLLWHFDQQVLRRELTRFHAIDEVADLEPLAAELAFGDDDQAPVTVDVGGRALSFRGYADRVDRRPDGSLVVTDYKTGSAWRYKSLNLDPVDRGTKLQLPLYGLAARERFAPDAGVRSRYWFISEQGRFEEVGYDVDASVLERFREVLGVIVDGITAGVFPARPGEAERGSWVNCMWCDYQQVCPSDRGRQWERKRGARELAAYVELAEAEPTADENDEQSDELVQLELS